MHKYDSIEMVQEVRDAVLDYFTDGHNVKMNSPFMQPVVYHLDQVSLAMLRVALGWENNESLEYSDSSQTDAAQIPLFDLGPYPKHERETGEI